MERSATPFEINVTDEVISTGLGGKLAKISERKLELAIPVDSLDFHMRRLRWQIELALKAKGIRKGTGEPTSTEIGMFPLDLENATVGDYPLEARELLQLRAAEKSLPPHNGVWRRIWQIRRWLDRREIPDAVQGVLSQRDLDRLWAECEHARELHAKMQIVHTMGSWMDSLDEIAGIVTRWAEKRELTPDQERALRSYILSHYTPGAN